MGGKNSPESINRYMAKAYDRIGLIVPKGEKEKIKAHAQEKGMSLNAYIVALIERDMGQERGREP